MLHLCPLESSDRRELTAAGSGCLACRFRGCEHFSVSGAKRAAGLTTEPVPLPDPRLVLETMAVRRFSDLSRHRIL